MNSLGDQSPGRVSRMGAREGMKPRDPGSCRSSHRGRWLVAALLLLGIAGGARAQDNGTGSVGQSGNRPAPVATEPPPNTAAKDTPTPPAAKPNDKSEVSSRDTGTTF